jgi:hypothetical protein
MSSIRGVGLAAVLIGLIACSQGPRTGPVERIRAFGPGDTPITSSGVTEDEGGWRVHRRDSGPVPLFEVAQPNGLESSVITYRTRMKGENLTGKAYLEMWVRVPGRGEFFSRGLAQPLTGTSGWASYEIPFLLDEAGTRADLVKMNVAFEGGGSVWIKDIELLRAPLAS